MLPARNALRSIMHWLRLVAPPGWAIVSIAIMALGVEFVACLTAWLVRDVGDASQRLDLMRQIHGVRDAVLCMAALGYGVFRIRRTHPLFQPDYRNFLAATPWNRDLPLPQGPIHLVAQDFVLLGALMAVMTFVPSWPLANVPLAFLIGYLVPAAGALAWVNELRFAWLVGIGLGLVVRLAWWDSYAALLAAAATYVVAWQGIWRSLAAFPWSETVARRRQDLTRELRQFNPDAQPGTSDALSADVEVSLLWPWNVLRFRRPERSVTPTGGWAVAALLGWWTYALVSGVRAAAEDNPQALHESIGMAWLGITILATACACIRLMVYVSHHQSPLSLWGRIGTGQWIILPYDVVLLTPLAVMIGGSALFPLLMAAGCPLPAAFGLCVAAIFGTALTGPPRLRHWQLTAPARLAPLFRPNQPAEVI